MGWADDPTKTNAYYIHPIHLLPSYFFLHQLFFFLLRRLSSRQKARHHEKMKIKNHFEWANIRKMVNEAEEL
jgi:hypothetical protein